MDKREFLEKRNAEKAAKVVPIAKTDINTNYDAQSAEYKAFRCTVNKWQKDSREWLDSEGYDFRKCVTFVVEKGTFTKTEKGKTLWEKLPEEMAETLNVEMAEMSENFLQNVCKK